MGEQFDAETYGRSFADVYDEWYPSDAATADAVDLLDTLTDTNPADVLELGIGTGRLALPLVERGHRVTGIDSSQDMLDRLDAKRHAATHVGGGELVVGIRADVARRDDWPSGPFDVVLAAFNMVFNVTEPVAQKSMFTAAFEVLRPGGAFVVECFVPAPIVAEKQLELRSVRLDRVVLIASESDPASSTVTGQHIELRDGEPVRLRPWRVRVVAPGELDRWATDAGFDLASRSSDWRGTPFDAESASHVSVYRRPT